MGRRDIIDNQGFKNIFKKVSNLKRSEKILDVACGIGTVPRLIYQIYGENNQIYGIDIDQNLIKYGQEHWGKPEHIHLQYGDVFNIQFQDNEFDVITSFGLLDFIERPLDALKEMVRVKKTYGRFIIITIEKSKYERIPDFKSFSNHYNEYLTSLKHLGLPIENEGEFIKKLFSKLGIETRLHKFIIENKAEITSGLIEYWENYFEKSNYMKFLNSLDFYFQFLKEIGWTREKFNEYIKKELSGKKMIDFFKRFVGKTITTRIGIAILDSIP